MKRSRPNPLWFIVAVDPGRRTGVAVGVFDWQGSVAETLQAYGGEGGSVFAREIEGEPDEQAREILEGLIRVQQRALWTMRGWTEDGKGAAPRSIRLILVIEGFHIRKMAVDLAPVEVTWALLSLLAYEGMRDDLDEEWAVGYEVVWQEPSEAKGFATSARLRQWGLWALGKTPGGRDHKRDALRHLALRVARLGEGG